MTTLLKNMTAPALADALKSSYEKIRPSLTPEQQQQYPFPVVAKLAYGLLHGTPFQLRTVPARPAAPGAPETGASGPSRCDQAVVPVIVSALSLALDLLGLEGAGETLGETVATQLLSNPAVLAAIREALLTYKQAKSVADKAEYIMKVLTIIFDKVGEQNLFDLIKSIDPLQWVELSVVITAQVGLWVATGGAALVAELALLSAVDISRFTIAVLDMFDACNLPDTSKAKLPEESDTPPAFCLHQGLYYMVWAGKSDKKINILGTVDAQTWNDKDKVTLDWAQSEAAPSVTSYNGALYIAWTQKGTQQIRIIYTWDGVNFPELKLPANFKTDLAPAIGAFGKSVGLVLAWADKGSGQMQFAISGLDLSFSTPALSLPESGGYKSAPAVSCNSKMIYVSWIGSESYAPLHIAYSSDGFNFLYWRLLAPAKLGGISISADEQTVWCTWQTDGSKIFYMSIDWGRNPAQLGKELATGYPIIYFPFIAWTGTNHARSLNVTNI